MEELKTPKDFEKLAISKMTENAKFYFSSGACTTTTPKLNEEAFNKFCIQPRVLRDVSEANLKTSVLNHDVVCPIGVSPTALHALAHPDAEVAMAAGCSKEGCIFILSCVCSCLIEDVANSFKNTSNGNHVFWMQLYIFRDRSATLDLLKKAERLGFSAIVLTVDSPVGGLWKRRMPKSLLEDRNARYPNLSCEFHILLDPSLTFADIKWLKERTELPIIVKGVMTGEDAKEAVRNGASAILVSNHGGRQIQRVVPTIDVLEEIVEAVKHSAVEVYIDSGIRNGSDIFVSLALGAKAVFVGRPSIWGLTVGGEEGVRRILRLLQEELLFTMKLAGVSSVHEIDKSMIRKTS